MKQEAHDTIWKSTYWPLRTLTISSQTELSFWYDFTIPETAEAVEEGITAYITDLLLYKEDPV